MCARETFENLNIPNPLSPNHHQKSLKLSKSKSKSKRSRVRSGEKLKYKRILTKSHISTRSTFESPRVYDSQISTKNILIQPYNDKQRGYLQFKYCCMALMKLLCSIWCLFITWFMFGGYIFAAYRYINDNIMDGIYPMEPAAFIGLFILIALCSCGCCIVCTWLAIDQMIIIKHNDLQNIGNCCDYITGKDRDKYYGSHWNDELLECHKVDYFINYYIRDLYGTDCDVEFEKDVLQLIYEYNGKDYVSND